MSTPTYGAMSSQELSRIILNREPLFILDVRNETDYENWKIEGVGIETMNIPYFEMLDGVGEAMDRLPQTERTLVVCAKEGSSVFVAERLAEAGREGLFYLKGGMKAWSEHLEPVKVSDLGEGGAMYQFLRLGKGCLSYLIVSDGEAVVVDPMRLTGAYEAFAKKQGAVIKHVLDTHLHADHISGGRELAKRTGAAYWLPPKDAGEVVFDYTKLEDGESIKVGRSTIRIDALYSPGHTIGSTSFIVDDRLLLSGDILFVESIGRPDLAGLAEDWVGDLRETLYGRYARLSPDLLVLPAHFGSIGELGESGTVSATLSELYARNAGLNIEDESEFRRTVTEQLPPQPNAYREIRQTNMGRLSPNEEEQREMEIGPNRCAVHG